MPDLAAAERVPRSVAALADDFETGVVIPAHFHRERHQLIYTASGSITVRAGDGLWMLPASFALWMPVGVTHEIRMNTRVEMRTLYIRPEPGHGSRECRVLSVSPLLRELILRAMELPALYDEQGMEGRLMQLLLDEVSVSPSRPLGLRMPRDPRLLRICERVLRDLASAEPLARLGASVGLSERSVIRLFPQETGLSFRRWHNHARLLKAFELFDQSRSVTRVALELGYRGPSAFAKMFRRAMGKAPLEMLGTPP